MKTPRFAHKIGESALARFGRNNIYEYLLFYLRCLWEGMKTPSFAQNIGESWLSGLGRNNVFEYRLLKMPLGRHKYIKFCT
jgi:hypothetical protein